MKKALWGSLGVGLACALCAASAPAATFTSALTDSFFSGEQRLSDNSAERLINANGGTDTLLDVGDRLRGILTIGTIEQGQTTNSIGFSQTFGGNTFIVPELSGLFDVAVFSKTDTVIPGQTSSGTAGDNVLDSGEVWTFVFAPAAGFQATYGAGAMVTFFMDTTPDFARAVVPTSLGGVAADIATLEGNASNGAEWWTFGYTAGGGALPDLGELWVAQAPTDDTNLAVQGTFSPTTFNIALSLLENNSPILLGEVFSALNGGGMVNALGSGNLNQPDSGSDGKPYKVWNNVDFTINNVVPEPGTMVLLGSGLLGLAGVARRKKNT